MKAPRIYAAVILIFLIQFEPTRSSAPAGEAKEEIRQKRRSPGEAEDDAVFAAAVLGLVHDRVRDVGNLFRVVGDTAGGLAGGSIKAVGATVNGLSSALDAVSRAVEPTPRKMDGGSSPPSASSDDFSETIDHYDPSTHRDHATGVTSETHPADQGQDASGSPDPFDRIASVARTSLAGSLKLVSAAVRGVGDAVFQAGTVAEELTGGTGQVAEDVVRVVQGAVGMARDDMLRFGERDDPTEGSQGDKRPPSAPGTQADASSNSRSSRGGENIKSIAKVVESVMPSAGDDAYFDAWTVSKVWSGACALARAALEVALRELAGLFRRRNGAPPPAPRLAVVFMLVVLIVGRRHRRRGQHSPHHQQEQQQQALRSVETAEPSTPQRSHVVVAQAPTSTGAVAAALTSPSRSLFYGSRWPRFLPARAASGSQQPSFGGNLGTLDDLDPILPSPAQARAPSHARVSRSRAAVRGRLEERAGLEENDVVDAQAVTSGRDRSEGVATRGPWDWRRSLQWMGLRKSREGVGSGGGGGGGGVGWRWFWIVLLWFAASVLEERERDRVTWLAWDEGFREGEAFRVADPSASMAESAAWLNHMISGMWDRHPTGQHVSQSSVGGWGSDTANEGVPEGLRAFVSGHVAAGIAEALEEFNSKPASVVRIELQEVDLGSSPPRVLGIKVLDATTPATPGYGDGKCTLAADCLALQIDLEVATRGLRVGFGVKPSTRGEKAVLPSGTVRLLELYLMGRLSVRVELRKEFPFVGMAFIAFDGDPEVQVRVEQWGLDALTLGAVDEWARVGLQGALKPFLLPGYTEIDLARALCPDCPTTTPVPLNSSSKQEEEPEAGLNTRFVLPSSRTSAAEAATITTAPDDPPASRSGSRRTSSSSKTLGREVGERRAPLNKNMG